MMVNMRIGAIAVATILVFVVAQFTDANETTTKQLGEIDKNPSSNLCSDEKSCKEKLSSYMDFIRVLGRNAEKTLDMFLSVVEKMTKVLNDNQKGRHFINKYNLPTDRAVESFIAFHVSQVSSNCDPKSCKCSMETYICHEQDRCPKIKVDREKCSAKPKCHQMCKMTTRSANGTTSEKNKFERKFKGDVADLSPQKGYYELIDALGVEVNFLAGPFALVAHQLRGLEPTCNGVAEDGKCLESGAASRRSFWCQIAGCEDDEVKLKRLEAEMRKRNARLREELDECESKLNHELYRKLDPKSVLMMREAFPIMTRSIDDYAKSVQCSCKQDVCEVNKKLWTCSQFCPNNFGCDTHKCDCPFH